jgi:flagellar hook assembly protein FlgD
VRTLWNGTLEAGVRTLTWDGTSDRGVRVPGGVYFIRFECGSERSVKRLAILR